MLSWKKCLKITTKQSHVKYLPLSVNFDSNWKFSKQSWNLFAFVKFKVKHLSATICKLKIKT